MQIILIILVSVSCYWVIWNIYKVVSSKMKSRFNIDNEEKPFFVKLLNFIAFTTLSPILLLMVLLMMGVGA